jgi:hypothetical protein
MVPGVGAAKEFCCEMKSTLPSPLPGIHEISTLSVRMESGTKK